MSEEMQTPAMPVANELGQTVEPEQTAMLSPSRLGRKAVRSILGGTGSMLDKARQRSLELQEEGFRRRGKQEFEQEEINRFEQRPDNTPLGDSNDSVQGELGEPTLTETDDLLDNQTPPTVEAAPIRTFEYPEDDDYKNLIRVDDDAVDSVMNAPENRTELLADGLSDFNGGLIPDANGIQERMETISRRYSDQIDEAKRGTIELKVTRQMADIIGASESTVKKVAAAMLERRAGEGISVQGLGMAETMLAARDLMVHEMRKLDGLAEQAAEGTLEQLAQFKYQMELVANLQRGYKGAQTEIARTLSAMRIPARDVDLGADTQEAKALRDRDLTTFLDDFGGADQIREVARRYQQLESVHQRAAFARGLKGKIGNALYEVWQHLLLTNPITQTKNIVGSFLTTMVLPNVELAGGVAIGKMRRMAGAAPDETADIMELQAQLFGQWMSLNEATASAWIAFKEIKPQIGISRLDKKGDQRIQAFSKEAFFLKNENGEYPPAAKYVEFLGQALTLGRIAFRSLEAGDTFFKVVATRGELYKQAMLSGVARGKQGDDLAEFIAEYVADPPSVTLDKMEATAGYATMTQKMDETGKALNTIRSKVPGMRWAVPFISTPYNGAKYSIVDRTPAGLIWGSTKAMIDAGGRQRDEAYARIAINSTVGLGIGGLTIAGLCSGGGPQDDNMKQALRQKGWEPYSCKIGDKWYSYGGIEPFATIMGLYADMVEIGRSMPEDWDVDKYKNLAGVVLGATLYNTSNKTFLENFAQLGKAVNEPSRYGPGFIENLAKSAVPRVVAGAERLIDPKFREARNLIEEYKSQIPGLSTTLKPKVDIAGNDIIPGMPDEDGGRDLALGPDVMSMVKISPVKEDPIADEMLRVKGVPIDNFKNGKLSIPNLAQPINLTDDALYFVRKRAGKLGYANMGKVIKSSRYQDLIPQSENTEVRKIMRNMLGTAWIAGKRKAVKELMQHEVFGAPLTEFVQQKLRKQQDEMSD